MGSYTATIIWFSYIKCGLNSRSKNNSNDRVELCLQSITNNINKTSYIVDFHLDYKAENTTPFPPGHLLFTAAANVE